MANPVLVEVTRGGMVESHHRGALRIADAGGRIVFETGDVDERVFPRSGIKILQALPLVESGAADHFGFGARELALACSSHSGEPEHVALAGAMLRAAGVGEEDLACGPQWPRRHEDLAAVIRAGGADRRIYNNCSGKHAGMLAHARHAGLDARGYHKLDHPLQREIAAVMEDVTGASMADAPCGIDGCSLPTCALPLSALAAGFGRVAAQAGMEPARAAACRRLLDACMSEPFMVAGTDRFCTSAMSLAGRAVYVKTGAEGIFCAAFARLGLGVAIKCDDGATRAAEVVMAAVIDRFAPPRGAKRTGFEALLRPKLFNWAGEEVGGIRPSEAFLTALGAA